MNAPHARRCGLEVWAPSVVPPIGIDLSDEQALAVAFRHLAGIGFAENMAGHITWQPDAHTQQTIHEQIGFVRFGQAHRGPAPGSLPDPIELGAADPVTS
ncbi:hypothetical protein A5695_09840 [Mycobacterium sp. E1747]|nr:hypothetical protein A5695_09840 [Mycobacterium sp. E1747]